MNKHLNYADSKIFLNYLFQNINQGLEIKMIILAITSGLRYQELVRLCEEDFNFDKNIIRISQSKLYKLNGGTGPLKNMNSQRVISVDMHTMKLFKDFFETRERDSKNIHNLVFFDSSSNTSVIENKRINSVLRDILKHLNISPIISSNGLRHIHLKILLSHRISISIFDVQPPPLRYVYIDTTSTAFEHISEKFDKILEDLNNKEG